MKRFYLILGGLALAAGLAAFLFFGPSLMTPPFEVSTVAYDVNADDPEAVHYEVFEKTIPEEAGHVLFCISKLYPGVVGDERDNGGGR